MSDPSQTDLRLFGNAATAALSRMPVLIERPGRYKGSGAWVVFMDSHVAYLPYPGPFPMTQSFIEGLSAIAEPK